MENDANVPALTPEGHAALVGHNANFCVGIARVQGVDALVTCDRIASPAVVTAVGVREDGTLLAERRSVPLPACGAAARAQEFADAAFAVGKVIPLGASEALDWVGLRGGPSGFGAHYAATFALHSPGHPDAEALCEHAATACLLSGGAASLAEAVDQEALDALACIGEFGHNAYEFYALARGARREARLQAAAAYPLFAAEITAQPIVKLAIDTRKPLADKLERAFGAEPDGRLRLSKALRNRFQGTSQPDHGIPADVLVQVLSQVPADWFPKDDAEWDAFCDLAGEGFRNFAPAINVGVATLCQGAGGKWAALRARVARAAADTFPPDDLDEVQRKAWRPVGDESPEGLRGAFRNALDMVRSFRDLVILPVAASDSRDDLPLSPGARDLATQASARLLFEGRNLVSIMESQRNWHTKAAEVYQAREPRPGDDPEAEDAPETLVADDGWAPLCDMWEAPNGVLVMPMTDPREIKREGKALGHCVGSYTDRCRSGESHIVSFRRSDGFGGYRFLSTAEFITPPLDSNKLEHRQHHGRKNGTPPADARAAFEWFVGEVAAGRIPLNRDGMMAYRSLRGRAPDEITDVAGYDRKNLVVVARCAKAWEPWMPKRLRGLDVDALRELPEMQALVDEVAPTYRYAAAI